MEPRIQYARTSDGVSIAFCTLGQGQPLLYMQQPLFATIARATLLPEIRAWCDRISATREVVILDHRGSGLSTREITDFSIESMERDIDAVFHRLGAETVDLWGSFDAGPIAIAFAAHNPERVRRLVLWSAWACGRDLSDLASMETIERLIDTNWKLYCQVSIQTLNPAPTFELKRHVDIAAEGTEPQTYRTFLRQAWEYDVTDLLPLVECPTLIANRRGNEVFSVERSSRLAAEIPNARLLLLERGSRMVWIGDSEAVASALDEFLEEARPAAAPADLPSGTAIILFADIADSTALTERLGDAAFRAKARDLAVSLRALIRECAGQPVEGPTLGDGVLAVFASAREAIQAALRCVGAAQALGLSLHLGLHAGDITREKDPDGRDNVYGGAVNIAARISGLSAAGEVLVSETVRSLARTSAGVRFEDRGEQELKGVGEAVRVWAVREGD